MDDIRPRRVSESSVHDQTAIVFPTDLNALDTVFGGRVLEQADRVAAVVAMRHSGRVCVTLGVDSVRFLAPAGHGDVLVFQAATNRAWRTSLEVGVKVWAEDFRRKRPRRHIFSAYFTFVAVDDRRRPVEVPSVVPETDDDRRRYAEADRRRQARLAERVQPRKQGTSPDSAAADSSPDPDAAGDREAGGPNR